jgi:putative ABC transport system permease protein
MKKWLTIHTALRGIALSPGRNALTVLTMAFGVATLTVAAGASRAARRQVEANLARLGKNILVVSAGTTAVVAGRRRQTKYVTTLTPADADAIRSQLSGKVNAVSPIQSKKLSIRRSNEVTAAVVVGTNSHYPEVRAAEIARGRFFRISEQRGRVRVAVLGRTVVDELYEDDEPVLGTLVRINRVPFRVIGLMAARGASLSGQDEDNQIFVPLPTALRRLFNQDHVATILVKFSARRHVEPAIESIRRLLRQRHHLRSGRPDDFTVQTQRQLVEARAAVARRFDAVITSVLVATLLVAVIGVYAVMTIGVRRRRVEIGIRRAVGATKKNILKQFILEAFYLSLLGGIGGMFLALAATVMLTRFLTWHVQLDPVVLSGGFLISVTVGLAAGIHPAWQAASIHPIEALRSTPGGPQNTG